ncbi:MAG: hypothetical protein ACM3NO_11730, partial [Deltaproteobacteria bacterium]
MRIKIVMKSLLAGALLVNSAAYAVTVKVAEGAPLVVRLKAELLSEKVQQGTRVDKEVAQAVVVNGQTVIPEGAAVWGAVQEAKKHKFIRFDVEGVRLPNLQQLKLRCISGQTKNSDKDMIRIETKRGDDVGAARGTQFNAYLGAAADVEVAPPPAPKPVPPAAAAALVVKPEPAYVTMQLFSSP